MDLATMKKYIAYARAKCAPVVTAEAAELLAGEYADIRQQAEGTARAAQALNAGKEGTNVGSVVPITVRQLEALGRITEAVATAEATTALQSALQQSRACITHLEAASTATASSPWLTTPRSLPSSS